MYRYKHKLIGAVIISVTLQSLKPSSHLLNQLSKTLRLSAIQDIALGLSLQYSSSPEIRRNSTQFLKQKLLQLINALIETGLKMHYNALELAFVSNP